MNMPNKGWTYEQDFGRRLQPNHYLVQENLRDMRNCHFSIKNWADPKAPKKEPEAPASNIYDLLQNLN